MKGVAMFAVRECSHSQFYKSLLRLTLNKKILHFRCLKICRHYSSKLTHYEVLGLTREASAEDIRAAYIKKSKECHPDVNTKDPTNHKQFLSVNEAYTVLIKPLSRVSYDAMLQHEQIHKQSTSQYSQPRYHYPDAEIQRVRDIRNRDRMWSSHKSTARSKRASNIKIVSGCLLLILIGSILHFLAFKWTTAVHLKNLDARDAMARKQWQMARGNQLNLLVQKQTEDHASRFHVQENNIPSER